MSKEESKQLIQKININHKKIISNSRNKLEMNKIFYNKKIRISNNKRQNTKNKNKNDSHQKVYFREEIKIQNVIINKNENTKNVKKNDIKNNTEINIKNNIMDHSSI